jgi:NADH dehydrogenase
VIARAGRAGPLRVVVVGGGFAGLEAARRLAPLPVAVTLVDRRNHHLFQPLLYQVATAALSPADVAAPIRHVLRGQANVEVVMDEVTGGDLGARRLQLASGAQLGWDVLLLAAGATHSYLGHDAWAPLAPGLKTVEDALEIRRRLLTAFEEAEREPDAGRQAALLTFAVVGGGPTGVELAGAIAEIARRTLAGDFRRISPAAARVVLLEAGPRLLPAFPERLSEAARRQLGRLGVEVRTAAPVTEVDEAGVTAGGERIAARTVLWGAGVAGSPLARALSLPVDRSGRVPVDATLAVPGHPDVLVLGDLASAQQADGSPVPGIASAALQMGRHAGRAVERRLRGQAPAPFRYRDKGLLATVGRAAAVARLGRFQLAGLHAWLLWLLVHIWFLVGFRNRVAVVLQWAWSYLTWRRGARLITETAEQARAGARGGAREAGSGAGPDRPAP